MVGGNFVADHDNAADVGFLGPAGRYLAVDQAVIDTGQADFHMVIGPQRRLWGSGFGGGRTLRCRGLNTLFCRFFQRFHALTAGFQRQGDQFVEAGVVVSCHEGFHQHGNVNPGDDLIIFFIDGDAAGRIERAAAPGIDQEQDATTGVESADFPVVFLD
ncbi:hypothetical protein D3C79_784010 [compost metagenome]